MKKSTAIFTLVCVITFILLCGAFLLTNIVHNIHYDYKADEQVINGLRIRARLLGQYEEDEKNTVYTGPYKLLISFKVNDNAKLPTLSKVGVVDKESNTLLFTLTNNDANIERGDATVYFSFKQVKIDYHDYDLLVEYKLKGSSEINTITLTLKRDYREFTSFRFWDRLMSV